MGGSGNGKGRVPSSESSPTTITVGDHAAAAAAAAFTAAFTAASPAAPIGKLQVPIRPGAAVGSSSATAAGC